MVILTAKFIIIVSLLAITIEDFRTREVHLFFYLTLIGASLFLMHSTNRWDFISVVFNLAYLLLILISVMLTSIVTKKSKNIFNVIGVGDIIFFLTTLLWLDPIQYVLFNTATFVLALLIHFIFRDMAFYKSRNEIPLAGIQSIFFIPVFILNF